MLEKFLCGCGGGSTTAVCIAVPLSTCARRCFHTARTPHVFANSMPCARSAAALAGGLGSSQLLLTHDVCGASCRTISILRDMRTVGLVLFRLNSFCGSCVCLIKFTHRIR
ncbi:hypothetical protein K466DRAFT_404592 [Polyporus arcularius HHB13444]|uniref:Uncharacterized protein n=1 Tax=Polyporus arcularius HHB13444 TaxID=1314778 RepID=A0A5C3NRA6_9APHY|nr:hypothetical protein K466DRAFT_404592 [Polyporus arcularius HHB13444]